MTRTQILILSIYELQEERAQCDAALIAAKAELAEAMGQESMVTYRGVVAKKHPNIRYEIHGAALASDLPAEVLDWFKEPVFTRDKLAHAVKAGYLAPQVAEKAVTKHDRGWVVSVKKVKKAG